MITAYTLNTLTTYTPEALTLAVGRKDMTFTSAKFLGITNGGQFCYMVTFPTERMADFTTKVFLTNTAGKVTADLQVGFDSRG